MKHKTIKTTIEEIELALDNPRYVNYLNGMYYRFVPISDGKIELTAIVLHDSTFDLAVRFNFFETDLNAFNLENGYKEISADEFYELANGLLSKYNLLPLKELV